jgi:hypothetical protein
MAITYQWVIQQMVTKPTEDGLQDVVIQANWLYRGIDTDDTGKIIAVVAESGQTPFTTPPNPDTFIPYVDLTEAQVIAWIEANVDMVQLNALIDYDIEQVLNPPVVILPLPWEQQTIG